MLQNPKKTSKTARHKAMDLLARREHSRFELRQKLQRYDYSSAEIEQCLDKLEQDSLLSDERFCEAYVKMRGHLGFGPVRILQELQQRGINAAMAEGQLQQIDWQPLAEQAYQKKYPTGIIDFKDRAKRMQFLNYRGYSSEQIKQIVGEE